MFPEKLKYRKIIYGEDWMYINFIDKAHSQILPIKLLHLQVFPTYNYSPVKCVFSLFHNQVFINKIIIHSLSIKLLYIQDFLIWFTAEVCQTTRHTSMKWNIWKFLILNINESILIFTFCDITVEILCPDLVDRAYEVLNLSNFTYEIQLI